MHMSYKNEMLFLLKSIQVNNLLLFEFNMTLE